MRRCGNNYMEDTRLLDEEMRSRLAAIVESSDDAIVAKDLDGFITNWNSSAERIFGYREDGVLGKPITIIIPPELQAQEADILRRLRSGERIEHFETVRVTKAGKRVLISLTVSPVRDLSGRIVGASKIARDVTQIRQSSRRCETANKECGSPWRPRISVHGNGTLKVGMSAGPKTWKES